MANQAYPSEGPIPLKTAKYSPLLIHKIMLMTLRFFFAQNLPGYRWNQDPKLTDVLIDTVNNIQKYDDEIQKKPRILINRGGYQINKVSLTQDLAEAPPTGDLFGLRDEKHMNFVQGGITIIVEASEEGVCEILSDMVSTFMTWSSDHICNMYRFKTFGYPMTVGECVLDQENKEKFKIVISTGYLMETIWVLKDDAVKLKGLFLNPVLVPVSETPLA